MKYRKLKSLYYEWGEKNNCRLESEIESRKSAYSTIKTHFVINPFFKGEKKKDISYELFCVPLPELVQLTEEIYKNSKELFNRTANMSLNMYRSVRNTLIINEIKSTNDIEGVYSTKREIGEEIHNSGMSKSREEMSRAKRLSGIVNKYMSISNSENVGISECEDFRKIYDELFIGHETIDNIPDGELFRNGHVEVAKGMNTVHVGIEGEENIKDKINELIAFMNRKDVHFLIKAIISHYILEYIHPFYDGNGRLGRLILSSYLMKKLDMWTAMSVSYSIAKNKDRYQDMFIEVSEIKNHGDMTFFVKDFLEIIKQGQESVLRFMDNAEIKFEYVKRLVNEMEESGKLSGCSKEAKRVLSICMQKYVFGEYNPIIDNDIISEMTEYPPEKERVSVSKAKRAIRELEDRGYIIKVKGRPITRELSEELKMILG